MALKSGEERPAGRTARRGRRTVLRAGFGAVIALLIFSTVQAYRIESSVSERRVEIYRDHVTREDALSRLCRNVLMGSTNARDFFLSTRPDRAAALESELTELENENRHGLALLERLRATGNAPAIPRALLEDYWGVLKTVPSRLQGVTDSSAYDFSQREITPRERAAYTALIGITEFYQVALQGQELAFARGRWAAVRRLMGLLALSVVLGLAVAWWSLRYAGNLEREAERQYDEVALAKHELQQLSTRLIEVQEEERRSLSRGLHDEIGQTLTALRIEISHALAKVALPEVREGLERARTLAERTVRSVRDISVLLRPALLDDLGLVPAVQWQAEDFSRRSGIICDFMEDNVAERMPDNVKTCAYRVVQEALHNVEKHAGPARVRIAIRQRPGLLSVEVVDDGRGFEPDAKGMPRHVPGIGLLGMRERAARIGAKLSIQSAEGHGTKISLEIPLGVA